jgi:cytochrome c6
MVLIACAACHSGGGNTLQAGATLRQADLLRNNVIDVQALYTIIYGGKGKMFGFGEGCAPKGQCTFGARLTDVEVMSLAEFVSASAAAGWK